MTPESLKIKLPVSVFLLEKVVQAVSSYANDMETDYTCTVEDGFLVMEDTGNFRGAEEGKR
jgi:hypothetical protein